MTGKGKGKTGVGWRYNSQHCRLCAICFLTFTEDERMRQVHPWQPLMTSEEVPFLRAPQFAHCLSILQERVCNAFCACVLVAVCLFISSNLVLRGKHYTCPSDGLQCDYTEITKCCDSQTNWEIASDIDIHVLLNYLPLFDLVH